jgi:transcriptional regulator with XRE-family HTH domain
VKSSESVHLGARIRQIRESLELTQAQFADRCGFPNRTGVVRYEAGRKRPNLELLIRIAKVGGVSLEWLLTGEDQQLPESKGQRILVHEAPVIYQSIIEELIHGPPELIRAIRDLIEVVKGPDEQATNWLLGNITVFAERTRAHTGKRRRRRAG